MFVEMLLFICFYVLPQIHYFTCSTNTYVHMCAAKGQSVRLARRAGTWLSVRLLPASSLKQIHFVVYLGKWRSSIVYLLCRRRLPFSQLASGRDAGFLVAKNPRHYFPSTKTVNSFLQRVFFGIFPDDVFSRHMLGGSGTSRYLAMIRGIFTAYLK